jgi:hypothetical protein
MHSYSITSIDLMLSQFFDKATTTTIAADTAALTG